LPIHDRRELSFDAAAIVAIVACSPGMARAIGMPQGRPDGARFDPRSGEAIVVYGAGAKSVRCQPEPLGALLIGYCLRTGIRVPRRLERSVRITADAAVLVFNVKYQVPPPRIAPEGRAERTDQTLASVASSGTPP
jgi:hypothetical protein